MSSNSIVTWQPVLTDHQSYTFSALARALDQIVEANVLYDDHPDRVVQGWTSTALDNIALRLHRSPLRTLSLLLRLLRTRNAIHIFCSPWEKIPLIFCLFFCAVMGCRYYLISEPYSVSETPYFGLRPTLLSRAKQRLRPTAYRIYGKIIRRTVQGVFAISDLAETQYTSMGIDRRRIIPFGYFVPRQLPGSTPVIAAEHAGFIRAVFVGSITTRKGIDTLVQTCDILAARNARVAIDIYGPGDLSLLEHAPPNLTYRGRIPFGQVQQVLLNYDLMILLSRHDGWAVVVNEALLSGRPVICTSSVGAARLVREHKAGVVVPSMAPGKTAETLELLSTDTAELERLKQGAAKAAEAISPERAADLMLAVISDMEGKVVGGRC